MPMTDLERDREAVLAVHHRYNKEAQATADIELLAELWDDDPSNAFYNYSGHNYRGLAQWSKLWEYFGERIEYFVPWTSFDTQVNVQGDVAWVTSQRFHGLRWIGDEDLNPLGEPTVRLTRSTEVMVRKGDTWKVVHAHFSLGSTDARPGAI
ncbi:nuclear transport factor 2 family protein [Pimelobacter simplex]|uniref:Nuclear transport factor 2 family protein n=1 Tax=Nocardioides simplex TaxID=2045 RepID=A0A7J5E3U6_NOCSI|nr:nuclear transport factor 2 family protein [Pimelobacter simplex]KAB2812931.1 nuclear transport factor 2 family protein [Pimelobacter simplex]